MKYFQIDIHLNLCSLSFHRDCILKQGSLLFRLSLPPLPFLCLVISCCSVVVLQSQNRPSNSPSIPWATLLQGWERICECSPGRILHPHKYRGFQVSLQGGCAEGGKLQSRLSLVVIHKQIECRSVCLERNRIKAATEGDVALYF